MLFLTETLLVTAQVISKIPIVSSVYNVAAKVLRYAAQVPEPGERPGYNPCSIM